MCVSLCVRLVLACVLATGGAEYNASASVYKDSASRREKAFLNDWISVSVCSESPA